MDQILQIFAQLGVDQSIFFQFAIFIFIFFALKVLFLDKLLFVLETREQKTSKLEAAAKAKFERADKLAQEHRAKIASFHQEAQKNFNDNKQKMEREKSLKIKQAEKESAKEFAEAKTKLIGEVAAQRKKVMNSGKDLSQTLVDKLLH